MKKLFILLLLTTLSSTLRAQFYPAKIYKTIDGLPSNAIFDVAQDDDGVMWFATSNGIATYDAHEWRLFPDSLRLPTYVNTKIKKAGDGSIWVVGSNRYEDVIAFHSNEKWAQIGFPRTWSDYNAITFHAIADDDGYTLLMGNRTTVFEYDFQDESWDSTSLEMDYRSRINSINYIDETIYVNTSIGQYVYDDGTLKKSELNDLFYDNHVLTMTKENDAIYVLGFNWLGIIKDDVFELFSDDLGITVESALNRHSLVVDSRGRIYYGSFSNAQIFDPLTGRRRALLVEGRQKNINSNRLFIDRESNIWSVDNRGLFKFNLIKFENFNSATGLAEDEVTVILEGSDGDFYIANEDVVNVYRNGEIVRRFDIQYSQDEKLVRILDMLEADNGSIYLAANGAGLIEFGGTFTTPFSTNKVFNKATTIERFKGDLYTSDGITPYKFVSRDAVPLDNRGFRLIRNMINIEDSVLAILTSKRGLLVYDGESVVDYSSDLEDMNNTYSAVKWNGELVVATGAGLGAVRDGKLVPFSDESPFDEVCFAVMVDSDNQLWVGTFNGIYVYDGEEVRNFYSGQGLVGNEINRNALIEDSKGLIWIGTELGLSIYNENEDFAYSAIPKPVFQSVSDGEGNDLTSRFNPRVSFTDNTISFSFKAISFIDNDLIEYRYRLNGIDENWLFTDNKGNTNIRYTSLDPGFYSFIVQAKNENSDWSEAEVYNFSIARPFTSQPIFFLIVSAALIGLFYGAFRIRFYLLVRQQKSMKSKISDATKEIESKNKELLLQKDSLQEALKQLENTQVQLIQNEKMAALGVLTAGVAHEINNPVNFIKSGAEVIKGLSRIENNHLVIEEKELYQQLLDSIDTGVTRIVNIVQSLNSFSRTNNTSNSSCEVNKILEDCLTILHFEYKDRITVHKQYSDQPLFVNGNEGQLYQVFTNLISNAIQSIESKGEITLITEGNEEDVVVKVIDDGIGIKNEDIKKIFDPFFTTKDPGEGTGLGLSIVFNIIEEHGGAIEYDSEENSGTTVTVRLQASTKS